MKNTKEIKFTPILIKELGLKLKNKMRENYRGILSISIALVNEYFINNPFPNDYLYFQDYKAMMLSIDLMQWLGENLNHYKGKKFNLTILIQKYESELKTTKLKLYELWSKNKLESELDRAIVKTLNIKRKSSDMQLTHYIEMLEDLIIKYPTFNKNEIYYFKEDIGL